MNYVVLLLPYDISIEICVIFDLIYVYMLVLVYCLFICVEIQRKCCRKIELYVAQI